MKYDRHTDEAAAAAAPDFSRTNVPNAAPGSPEPPEFFDSALEALSAAVPQGATVKAIGYDSVDKFLRAGYRAVDGEADAVIARGGEREFAAARNVKCERLILCPTHAYAAAACSRYRATDDTFAVMTDGRPPLSAVFDRTDTDRNLASIFGEIAALDLCAFDLAFCARMRGEAADDKTQDEVAKLVTDTTDALKGAEKDEKRAAEILVGAGRRAARIVAQRPELLHFSGAAQTAEAVRMLYCAEEREIGMRGETEMLLVPFVTEFYAKNLAAAETLEFPPDNNRRIDSICEYFKTDVRRACVYTSAIYPPLKMRLCEYRRNEFRADFAARLSGVKRRNVCAWRVFKRLYPDDGYGLKKLIDREDLGLCLALAPDVFAADTMLSFLNQTGRLEKYLI